MSVLIASIILITISSAYAIVLKRKLTETLFLSMVTVVLIIYCAGWLHFRGSLLVGLCFVVLLAVLSLIYCVRKLLKNARLLYDIDFIQGLLLFLIIIGFSLYMCYNIHWYSGDELSYWANAVKHMYFMDAFTTLPSDIGRIDVPAYLPGTAISHYFFSRFSGTFIEYPAYISMDMLYFSLFMPLLKDVFTKKGAVKGLLLIIVSIFLPLSWIVDSFPPFTTLTIDCFMGCLFGISVIYYFANQYEKSTYGVLVFSAAVFLLVLSKDIGLVLAMAACGIAFVDIVLFRRSDIKALLKEKSLLEKLRIVAWLLLPVILSGLAIIPWKIICRFAGLKQHPPSVSFSDVVALLTNQLDDGQHQVIKIFFRYFFIEKIPNPNIFTMASFTLIFIVTASILAYLYRYRIKLSRSIAAIVMTIFGLALYEAALLLVYVFSFYTIGQDAYYCLPRYNSPYVIGMQIFLLLFLFIPKGTEQAATFKNKKVQAKQASSKKGLSLGLTVVLGVLMLAHIYQIFIFPLIATYIDKNHFMTFIGDYRHYKPERYIPRYSSAINKYMDYIKSEPSNQINIISQAEDGWWRARMVNVAELYPHARIITKGWSVTVAEEIPDDLPAYPPPPLKFSPEEWEEYVLSSRSSLLYVDKSDEPFIKSYGHFFSDGVTDGMLYRVQNNDGHMLLVPVE